MPGLFVPLLGRFLCSLCLLLVSYDGWTVVLSYCDFLFVYIDRANSGPPLKVNYMFYN